MESEDNDMNEKKSSDLGQQEVHMTIDGHKITICFSQEYNPKLASLVKETLIDSFLRKNGIRAGELPA